MIDVIVNDDYQRVREEIESLLSQSAESSGRVFSPLPITLELVDEGEFIGGLTGATNWNWLYIETLAVHPSYRSRGLASQLVTQAEDIAIERGCVGSWVDTFSFQAPNFYNRLGYESFGEIQDYPDGSTRIFLCKRFKS